MYVNNHFLSSSYAEVKYYTITDDTTPPQTRLTYNNKRHPK